jgi:hypothetical protein
LLRHLARSHHPGGADAGMGHHHFSERPGVHDGVEWAAGGLIARDLVRGDSGTPDIEPLGFRKIAGVEMQDRYRRHQILVSLGPWSAFNLGEGRLTWTLPGGKAYVLLNEILSHLKSLTIFA